MKSHWYRFRTFFWLFLVSVPFLASATTGEVNLDEDGALTINQAVVIYHTPDTISGKEAWRRISNGSMTEAAITSNEGMTNADDAYWVVAHLKNIAPQTVNYYLKIAYPQLDIVHCYEVKEDSALLLYRTGDSYSFDQRPVLSRNFVLPLTFEGGESRLILINLDKRKSSIRFPMTISPESIFFKTHFNENLINSFLFGFLLLVILASAVVGLISRNQVFLVYSFYVFAFSMWLFARLGYAYQFLTSNYPELNRHFLPVMSQLSIMALIWYVQRFFNTRKHLPHLNKVMVGIQIFFVSGYLFWATFPDFMVNYATKLFPVRYSITLAVLLFAIYSAIHHLKINRFKAWMFLAGYMVFFLAILGKILMEYGVYDDTSFHIDPIVLGFVIEIMVLSTAMFYQLKKLIDPKIVNQEPEETTPNIKQHITLKSKAVLALDRIVYIQAAGHYLEFFTTDKTNPEIDRNKLKLVSKELPDKFIQIHRSYIVNADFIKIKYANKVLLHSEVELPVSRTFKENLD